MKKNVDCLFSKMKRSCPLKSCWFLPATSQLYVFNNGLNFYKSIVNDRKKLTFCLNCELIYSLIQLFKFYNFFKNNDLSIFFYK